MGFYQGVNALFLRKMYSFTELGADRVSRQRRTAGSEPEFQYQQYDFNECSRFCPSSPDRPPEGAAASQTLLSSLVLLQADKATLGLREEPPP